MLLKIEILSITLGIYQLVSIILAFKKIRITSTKIHRAPLIKKKKNPLKKPNRMHLNFVILKLFFQVYMEIVFKKLSKVSKANIAI